MFKRILVAYNGSQESLGALKECIRLCQHIEPEIHLLVVVNPHHNPIMFASDFAISSVDISNEDFENNKKTMQSKLESGEEQLKKQNLNCFKHLEIGEPVDVIAKMAADLAIDLVIVGHSKRVSRTFRWWGGTTDAILTEKVNCSLLIASSI